MTTRAARTLRGSAFALIAVLLAAAAHTLADGGAPSPLFCAVVAVLAAPVAVLLAGTRPRAWRTAAAVAASQVVFHAAFTLVGDLGRWDAAASGHVHALDPVAGPAAAVHPPSAGMLLAHAAAAAITALLVLRGERAVVAVWRWARARLRRVAGAVRVPLRHRIPPLPRLSRPRTARVTAHPLSRRGPPPLSAVV